MHFTFIFIVVLVSISTSLSSPAPPPATETTTQRPRPIQQFFKNIFNALRRTTTEAPPTSTTKRTPSSSPWHSSSIQIQEIPNFVDFSTYLLESLMSNNSAIKFTYMQPSSESVAPTLRGNYSVVSFLIPHDAKDTNLESKGVFSFLSNLKVPWNRQPAEVSNTDISKFPPLLEYFTQRIQAYFSVYKYTDDSRLNNTFVLLIPETPEIYNDFQSDIVHKTSTEVSDDNLVQTTTDSYEPSTEITNELE